MTIIFVEQPNGGFSAVNFTSWHGALRFLERAGALLELSAQEAATTIPRDLWTPEGRWLVSSYHGTPTLTVTFKKASASAAPPVMETLRARVARLETETASAYSFDRYGESGWRSAIRFLISLGLSDLEVSAVMRSKWTRWAGDIFGDRRYGRLPGGKALEQYLKETHCLLDGRLTARGLREVRQLTIETYGVL